MSAATVPAASRTVSLRYDRKSEVRFDGTRSDVVIALDAVRATQSSAPRPALTGRVRDEALLRDALATLFMVRDSDLRYAGKDRSAYLAYLLAKGKRAGVGVWEAQKAMITRELEGDAAAVEGCDPVLTIDDEAAFEVFSRDESAYARLSFPLDFFDDRKVSPGTGFFQAPPSLLPTVSRLRSYLPLHLDIGVGDAQGEPIERTAAVGAGWLKSFLQVQSAAMLPATTCEIAPVDLYNILYVLSVRRAKKAPRALRFELLPGKKPRIVIEPFGVVLETHGAPYSGSKPMVI
ncbi:MAG TPA: SWIM zinc finger family protein, partial [Polyangium sp.]|nr:SWIM zinc finger family protein [Polyangium sp.]